MLKNVALFCASSTKIDDKFHEDAVLLAELLVKNNISIRYGGGAAGLMGTVANTMMQLGGTVTGIIPEFMMKMEWGNNDITDLIVVNDMAERKKMIIENTDAVITLAGGIGTLDELVEVITLKQLGQYTKPIIVLNTNNFFKYLLLQLEQMIDQRFMRLQHGELWHVVKSPEEVINALHSLEEVDKSIISSAQV